ncbi:MAG: GtrA family protein [Coxiellaceae bacterium]|nr:GtrA family protein [Coxiellaceae bacterium]
MMTLIKKILSVEYACFGIVGGTSFIIDTGLFTLLHHDVSYALARIMSIMTAMTFNWLANRTFTFNTGKKITPHELLKYIGSNAIGASINFGVFLSLCSASVFFKAYYLIPLVLATSVSMIWNFTLAKYYIFR